MDIAKLCFIFKCWGKLTIQASGNYIVPYCGLFGLAGYVDSLLSADLVLLSSF